MRKHYIRCLAVLSMIVGVFQFGVAESFAEASTATVTTEYALYDTLSVSYTHLTLPTICSV